MQSNALLINNLKLISESDPRLRKICDEVDLNKINELLPIIEEMKLISKNKNALGLAAPQVGIMKRFFLISNGQSSMVFINPTVVIATDELLEDIEGCLSFPNLQLKIKRPSWVNAAWYDENGIFHQQLLEEKATRVFLHELDHLNGILFVDRISKLKLHMANKKRNKLDRKNSK